MSAKRFILALAACASLVTFAVAPAQAANQPMPPGWSPGNPTAGWAVSWGYRDATLAYSGFTGYARTTESIWGQAKCTDGYNCTRYAAYRLRANGARNFVQECPSGSNAASWDERARLCGITVNATPAPGSILQWDAAAYGNTAGHVAYVDAVYGDSILVSEAGCSGGAAREVISLQRLRNGGQLGSGVEFIHARDLSNPGNAIPQATAEAYVTSIYGALLGRAPDAAGLAMWSQALMNGTPYSDVANGITASDEYRLRLIDASYRRYLGRGADPAGAQGWLATMRGGATIESVDINLVASQESYNAGGGTDAGWVGRLYSTVLGRGAGQSEIDAWVGQLRNGASRADVARGFIYSTEHLNGVVDGFYMTLLGRHADPTGLGTWVPKIQAGTRDEEVIAAIASSQEFLNRI